MPAERKHHIFNYNLEYVWFDSQSLVLAVNNQNICILSNTYNSVFLAYTLVPTRTHTHMQSMIQCTCSLQLSTKVTTIQLTFKSIFVFKTIKRDCHITKKKTKTKQQSKINLVLPAGRHLPVSLFFLLISFSLFPLHKFHPYEHVCLLEFKNVTPKWNQNTHKGTLYQCVRSSQT